MTDPSADNDHPYWKQRPDATLDLDALEALGEKASPGPWKSFFDGAVYRIGERGHTPVFIHGDRDDAAFVVALRNAAPALISAARELDTLREALEAAGEALETFAARTEQPGFDKAPYDSPCTFFCIDATRARAALAKVRAALRRGVSDETEVGCLRE